MAVERVRRLASRGDPTPNATGPPLHLSIQKQQRKRVSERVVGGVPGDTFGGGRLVICFRALQYIYIYTARTLWHTHIL